MKSDIIKFFNLQRRIFGVCPHSGEFFRLSDCKIYLKTIPPKDWMDKLDLETDRLDKVEDRIDEKEESIREKAREEGRREANRLVKRMIKKIDPVFTPRKLNPDDAKVMFHPIDYIVFNGMKNYESMKNIFLLDRESKSSDHRKLQKSIENVVNKGNFEWLTLRVKEDGSIKEET